LLEAQKEIKQLRIVNRNLARNRHSHEQQPRDTTYIVQTLQKKQMITSQHSSNNSDVSDINVTYDVPRNNRKRTADEQHQNDDSAKEDPVHTAKRSFLRKSIESIDTKGESSEYVTATSQPDDCEDQTKLTDSKIQRRSRRSVSLPPNDVSSAEIISSNQKRFLKPHKRENSRLLAVKNTRISSSCDDLYIFLLYEYFV
jgi:hypothetical protein